MSREVPDNLRADLSAYLDGELPPERVEAVERTLATSAECRRVLIELRETSQALAQLPRHAAPGDFARTTLARAPETLGSRSAPRPPMRVARLAMRLTGAAAVIGGAALVAWYGQNQWPFTGRKTAPAPAANVTTADQTIYAVDPAATEEDRDDLSYSLSRAPADKRAPDAELELFGIQVPSEYTREWSPSGTAAMDSDDSTPVIEIEVTPQNEAQYAAALADLIARFGDVPDAVPAEFSGRLTVDAATATLAALHEHAPGQVFCANPEEPIWARLLGEPEHAPSRIAGEIHEPPRAEAPAATTLSRARRTPGAKASEAKPLAGGRVDLVRKAPAAPASQPETAPAEPIRLRVRLFPVGAAAPAGSQPAPSP